MTHGLHHTTGITGDAQANADFYAGLLGLRLVLRTVNHEDPGTLHLFYGDAQARPGTLLTFFAWPDTARGRRGVGQATEIGLTVPLEHIGFWVQRFLERSVRFTGPTPDGERTLLALEDPDGLPITLVGTPDAPAALPWDGSDVPTEASIRGLHHVTLWSDVPDATGRILADHLGFAHVGTQDSVRRYRSDAPVGHTVLVRDAGGFWPSAGGVGTLHHVAFRTASDAAHERLAERLSAEDVELNPLREHGFFRSLYFREPGGAILEVATDRPGLAAGQPRERLGLDLVLPEELEAQRTTIEVVLPAVVAPVEPRPPKRDLGWVHRYVPGSGGPTLLLLHGSGGNETSLLAFARAAAPTANLLTVRGRSLEEGAPRFFRRYADGFDLEQLAAEADALAAFVADAADVYGFDLGAVIAYGYSNGANIALASLARNPGAYAGAVLVRPVLILEAPPAGDLAGTAVLALLGTADAHRIRSEAAVAYLQNHGAEVHVGRLAAGHDLTPDDGTAVVAWLRALDYEGA